MTIRILHHLARTGGTVISKAVSAMPQVVLLSELHPRYPVPGPNRASYDPLEQAAKWHSLIDRDEINRRRAAGLGFVEDILFLRDAAAERGCSLVIRDWSNIDFIGVPYNDASGRLEIFEALAPHDDVTHFCTVRHPVTQWKSLTKLAVTHRVGLTAGAFMTGYLRFAEKAAEIGFVRYEDFCALPDINLQRICAGLDLHYDPEFEAKLSQQPRLTGDVDAIAGHRVMATPQSKIPDDPEMFVGNPDYKNAIRLLGYPH